MSNSSHAAVDNLNFKLRKPFQDVEWRKIAATDTDKIYHSGQQSSLGSLIDSVAYGKVDRRDVNVSGPQASACELLQLSAQYLIACHTAIRKDCRSKAESLQALKDRARQLEAEYEEQQARINQICERNVRLEAQYNCFQKILRRKRSGTLFTIDTDGKLRSTKGIVLEAPVARTSKSCCSASPEHIHVSAKASPDPTVSARERIARFIATYSAGYLARIKARRLICKWIDRRVREYRCSLAYKKAAQRSRSPRKEDEGLKASFSFNSTEVLASLKTKKAETGLRNLFDTFGVGLKDKINRMEMRTGLRRLGIRLTRRETREFMTYCLRLCGKHDSAMELSLSRENFAFLLRSVRSCSPRSVHGTRSTAQVPVLDSQRPPEGDTGIEIHSIAGPKMGEEGLNDITDEDEKYSSDSEASDGGPLPGQEVRRHVESDDLRDKQAQSPQSDAARKSSHRYAEASFSDNEDNTEHKMQGAPDKTGATDGAFHDIGAQSEDRSSSDEVSEVVDLRSEDKIHSGIESATGPCQTLDLSLHEAVDLFSEEDKPEASSASSSPFPSPSSSSSSDLSFSSSSCSSPSLSASKTVKASLSGPRLTLDSSAEKNE